MKIILRADVENLGQLGDIVDVAPGYGRNYLLPQGLAMLASATNLKNFELERKKLQAKMDEVRAQAQSIADKLENYVLTITMRVGDNDKLYGSVSTHTIADLLLEAGIEIDRRRVLLDAPLRTLGEHPVRVRLHADIIPAMIVNIVAEDRNYEEAAPVAEKVEEVVEEAVEAPIAEDA